MDFNPDFEKLLDRKIEEALKKNVREPWWYVLWLGVTASLIATALWAGGLWLMKQNFIRGKVDAEIALEMKA
ncbi:hypothetical protein [Rhizobium alvei]|uniref:Uncharacterized protein n=1 Tax=Rhizobium alvei TaxID=1132659 RepID=A0ABT8YTL9_9HYPH|nr:hypothetical protein [Rhizobium alvei]MDO6966737.1 hypothetical protein [Rhizobium alvei]